MLLRLVRARTKVWTKSTGLNLNGTPAPEIQKKLLPDAVQMTIEIVSVHRKKGASTGSKTLHVRTNSRLVSELYRISYQIGTTEVY